MRKMTRIIAPALVAAMAVGAATSAQAYPTPYRADQIRAEINDLTNRVNRNDWNGQVSDWQAQRLRGDVFRLRQDFRQYNRDGLSDREMSYLQGRIDNLRQRLGYERDMHDWRQRTDRYDRRW